jgi:hypothetical protein
VDTTSIRPTSGEVSRPSTRHIRCDYDFLELLEEDYRIPHYALLNAFMGMPAEPKKSAIALCEWAIRAEDPPRALLGWARKNRRGTFRRCEDHVGDEDL